MNNQQGKTRSGFSIMQCKAKSYCPKAINKTNHIAIEIEKLLQELKVDEFIKSKFGDKIAKHHVFDVVFSGCPNGCSKPQIDDIGIMGRAIIDINQSDCIACMKCVKVCKENALSWDQSRLVLDEDLCVGCSDCVKVCPTNAITEKNTVYRIFAGGRLGRHPQLAMEVVNFVEEAEVVDIVRGLIQYFKEYGNKEERLADVFARLGIDSVREYLQKIREEQSA